MSLDIGSVETAVQEVQAVGDEILEVLEGVDPALALPSELAEKILNLSGTMLTKALAAFQGASGTPITADSIAALMPNSTPLDKPTS